MRRQIILHSIMPHRTKLRRSKLQRTNLQPTLLTRVMLPRIMPPQTMEIKTAVRQFIAENVQLGVHQTTLEDTTPLVTGGLIDSIGMIGLVAFLEERFKVEFVPREIDVHSLDTLEQIEEVIRKKLAAGKSGAASSEQQGG
jgi:acyl carrier protein